MRRLILLGALALAGAGCSSSELAGEDCIILANGGNKLCGQDAKAWCDSTDALRQGDPALGIPSDTRSQAVCDSLR